MYKSDHTRRKWDNTVDINELREIARHVWGEDSQPMMEDFEPSETTLVKYYHNVMQHEQVLAGRRVLDIGCHAGLFSYMIAKHGASHVVGLEPRGMFVDGLNSFVDHYPQFQMEFHRGDDTDVARMIREHDIDTVFMIGVDPIIDWESTMRDVKRSKAEWVVMQVHSVPDSWVQFDQEAHDFADKGGAGMPVGFTLHYEQFNCDTRHGINPLHKDSMDTKTGYQHISPSGAVDLERCRTMHNKKSRKYVRRFVEHTGFTVESLHRQPEPIANSPNPSAKFGHFEFYLLRNG